MNANDARLVWIVGTVLAGYLMGSVPFGLLIAKARGVDLRNSGSGNIGATNVFRCVGKGWGVLALLLDALKGFLPAFFFPALAARGLHGAVPSWLGVACGLAAVVGHNWPVWLGFKGGKGVATSAGMALGVAPGAVGIGRRPSRWWWWRRGGCRWRRCSGAWPRRRRDGGSTPAGTVRGWCGCWAR